MWLEGHYKEKVNSVYQRHMGITGVKKKKKAVEGGHLFS